MPISSNHPAHPLSNGPVLVVDDEVHIRETVAEILRLEGYVVETASNGQEALEKVERTPPSVVLLDLRMPVLDGWGFARALEARGLELPIVVMTAASDALRWCREIGANECVPKPFDLPDIVEAVARIVGPPPG